MKLEGMGTVLANLNRAIAGIEGRTKKGMIKAALLVKGEAIRETPRDTGNLANSAYTQFSWAGAFEGGAPKFVGKNAGKLTEGYGSGRAAAHAEVAGADLVATIGYTAFYAPFVHEINKNYRQGNWQFLRNALAKNEMKILGIIKEEARIK